MPGKRPGQRRIFLLLSACVVVPAQMLEAQAVVAPSGRTLFNRASLVRSFARVDRSSLEGRGISTDSTQYGIPLALIYGFYPKWSLIVAQPFVNVDMTTRTANETRRSSWNGLADLQTFLQYDGLYSRNTPGGLTRLSGIFGVQAPTGARRFSTGAFEYTTGLIFEKAIRLKYVFTSDFEYTFATENSRGVATGDSARFDAAPAYFVIPREQAPPDASWMRRAYARAFRNGAYLILELNGNWQAQMRNRGIDVPNTGGTTLFVSPGLQYFLSRSFLLEFSSPIPAVDALNGVQPHSKVSFVFGFRVLL